MNNEQDLKDFIPKIIKPLYLNLSAFNNYTEYVKKCDVAVRSSYNKYLQSQFKFKKVDVIGPTETEQLWDIWTSISSRQNRPINLMYEKPNGTRDRIKEDHWPIQDYTEYQFPNVALEFYAIYNKDVIIAYIELIFVDKIGVVHSTLGHFDYLKCGIMKALFLEVIRLKWGQINKLIYGSANQKDFFKTDLLIENS